MSSEGLGLRIEGREYRRLGTKRTRCAPAAFCPQPSALSLRHGVTLVELLITAAIVATLSATFLGVSNLAMESGRAARTKSTIAKLHGLLMEKWAEYETRRVDTYTGEIATAFPNRRLRGMALADVRLLATRELMKLEMPDRWSDVIGNNVGSTVGTAPPAPAILAANPGIRSTYFRKYLDVLNKTSSNATQVVENQGAECLYMIIMLTTGDGEARTLFSDQDIGDTDDDGAPEFLDGWGRPIEFIRWPAGFSTKSDLIAGDADTDHDPYDLFRRDLEGVTDPASNLFPNSTATAPFFTPRAHVATVRNRNASGVSAYRLVPLIYSSGPDGITDIATEIAPASVVSPTSLDPYAAIYGPSFNFALATAGDVDNDGDDNSLDNIHNHLQDNR